MLDQRVEDFSRLGTPETVIPIAKNDHVRFKRSVVDRLLDPLDAAPHEVLTLLDGMGRDVSTRTDEKRADQPCLNRMLIIYPNRVTWPD